MDTSTRSVWQQLQELTTDGVRLQARWARNYAALAVSAVQPNGPTVRNLLGIVGSDGAAYVREVSRLSLDYARTWQGLAMTANERLGDSLTGAQRAAGAEKHAPGVGDAFVEVTVRPRPAATTRTMTDGVTKKTAKKSTRKSPTARKAAKKAPTKRVAKKGSAT